VDGNEEIHLTQPHLIDQILKELRLDPDKVETKGTPLPPGKPIHKFEGSPPFDGHFNMRSIIGKLLYLDKSTWSDISHAVHALAQHTVNPTKQHGELVKWLGRYLAGTRDKGPIFRPVDGKFDCYVDASFCTDWDKDAISATDPTPVKSRTGYVIRFANCPIVWASKLQSLIALSTTEAEVIALSTATREIIHLIKFARELKYHGYPVAKDTPTIKCRIFEDNSGCLEIAKVPKVRPRTKHMATQIFHFRHHVEAGDLMIEKCCTTKMAADHLTKSTDQKTLKVHQKEIQGWDDTRPEDIQTGSKSHENA
jgi:hypothetical protein